MAQHADETPPSGDRREVESPTETEETANEAAERSRGSLFDWLRAFIILGWIVLLPLLATPWGQSLVDRWLRRGGQSTEKAETAEDPLPGPRWEESKGSSRRTDGTRDDGNNS